MTYREYLNNDFSKQDYYLAQICAVIAGLFNKGMKVKDFLLHFHTKEELAELELDENEEENAMEAASSARGMMDSITGGGVSNGRGMGGDISVPKRN